MKKEKTMAELILEQMKKKKKCEIFMINDFYYLGSISAIKTALHRLEKEGKIYRVISGFYTIPYYSKLIGEYSYPTIEQLAQKIALKYAWNISLTGEGALNQVGLSTQVPAVYHYVSDGPYRKYIYLNKVIYFNHTTERTISNYSKPLALIIQSIKTLGKGNITDKDIMIMANFCNRYVKENILKKAEIVPEWIYQILKKINEVQNNE